MLPSLKKRNQAPLPWGPQRAPKPSMMASTTNNAGQNLPTSPVPSYFQSLPTYNPLAQVPNGVRMGMNQGNRFAMSYDPRGDPASVIEAKAQANTNAYFGMLGDQQIPGRALSSLNYQKVTLAAFAQSQARAAGSKKAGAQPHVFASNQVRVPMPLKY